MNVGTLELAQVVVATVATVCMIGLGFLHRPGRATATWSLAFVIVMVAAYAAMVAASTEFDPLRLTAMGVLMCAPALIWSGLRSDRGARSHVWLAAVVAVASPTAFLLTASTDAFSWTFRIAFAVVGAFAGLTVAELVRRPGRGGGTSFPLTVFSVIVAAATTTSLAAGVLSPDGGSDMTFLRTVNSVGMLAYTMCALVTLLFFARRGADAPERSVFAEVADDRLRRAQSAGERSWALLYVQLDDAADLEAVLGTAAFATLVTRLREDICEIFPTEADIGQVGPAAFEVLTAQPSTVLRDRVRSLVRAVAASREVTRDAMDVGTSASIGWAGVSEFGYDLENLTAAARDAAERSAAAGGDRWERATA
ncbi:MAG TPA: hypothetical protein VEP72_09165 [Microbacterium sp.]|nr:hypothetical protein [Microbacterium sp.]